jgi:putative transposase
MLQLARDASLSPFMQWWMTSHVRRYHRHYHSHGHVWQGRFKSFPIQQDGHLLTVLRYVLRNPVRAKLVEHAREWPWSSLRFPHLLDPFPGLGPAESPHWLDAPLLKEELATLRTCVNRRNRSARLRGKPALLPCSASNPHSERGVARGNLCQKNSLSIFRS